MNHTTRSSARCLIFWLWVLLGLIVVACDKWPSDPASNSTAGEHEEENPIRIVSLAPALTQMLVDMGYGNCLVGVAEHDLASPPGVPVVGNYRNVNTEALMALRPTVVLAMSTQDAGTDSLVQLSKQYRFPLVSYPSPNNVQEICDILFDPEEFLPGGLPTAPPGQSPGAPGTTGSPGSPGMIPGGTISLGKLMNDTDAAFRVYAQLNTQLNKIRDATFDAHSPRVLMALSTDPLMASGPGTVLNQLLSVAGGENVLPEDASQSPTLDRERVLALKPDVILVIEPGGLALENWDRDPRVMSFRGLDIPAVKNKRIAVINHRLAMLPSSSVGLIAAEMAKAIHPDLTEAIDQALKESRPFSQTQPADESPSPPSPAPPGNPGNPGNPQSPGSSADTPAE